MESCKTKTKAITPANRNSQNCAMCQSELKASKFCVHAAGSKLAKNERTSHSWVWFCFFQSESKEMQTKAIPFYHSTVK